MNLKAATLGLLQGAASSCGSFATLHREHLHRRRSPAQTCLTQRFNNEVGTGAYVAQEIGRDKQTMANLLATHLKSGRDVDRVAEISDLATRVSAFADHHWAGMQPCTEERDRAELLPIRVRLLRDPVSGGEEAI